MRQLIFTSTIIFLSVFTCCQQVKNWEETKEENTIDSYYKFIANHPESPKCDSALLLIVELEWQLTKKAKSEMALDSFQSLYGNEDGYQDSIKNYRELLNWEKALEENTVDAYMHYLHIRKTFTYLEPAKKKIEALKWKQAKNEGTKLAYLQFLQEYALTDYIDSIGFKLQFGDFKGYQVTFYTKDMREDINLNFGENEDLYGQMTCLLKGQDKLNGWYDITGKYNNSGIINFKRRFVKMDEEGASHANNNWETQNVEIDNETLTLKINGKEFLLYEFSELYIGD